MSIVLCDALLKWTSSESLRVSISGTDASWQTTRWFANRYASDWGVGQFAGDRLCPPPGWPLSSIAGAAAEAASAHLRAPGIILALSGVAVCSILVAERLASSFAWRGVAVRPADWRHSAGVPPLAAVIISLIASLWCWYLSAPREGAWRGIQASPETLLPALLATATLMFSLSSPFVLRRTQWFRARIQSPAQRCCLQCGYPTKDRCSECGTYWPEVSRRQRRRHRVALAVFIPLIALLGAAPCFRQAARMPPAALRRWLILSDPEYPMNTGLLFLVEGETVQVNTRAGRWTVRAAATAKGTSVDVIRRPPGVTADAVRTRSALYAGNRWLISVQAPEDVDSIERLP